MPRKATWRVRRWDIPGRLQEAIDDGRLEREGWPVPFQCEHCGRDAECPTLGPFSRAVEAVVGMTPYFDPPGFYPPEGWAPQEIECRKCHWHYGLVVKNPDKGGA